MVKRKPDHVREERSGFRGAGRFTFEVTDEAAAQALRDQAAAHGRSVEAELEALVRKTYAPQTGASPEPPGEDWVHRLIRIANGAGEGVFDEEPTPLRDFDL
ncbi:MAG: FitA-like ribbon-helix-helix domain-containing protein [Allosphingosinicella sp.]